MRLSHYAVLFGFAASMPPQSLGQREAAPEVVRPVDRKSPGYAAYQRANQLFAGDKLTEARKALEESLRLDPKLVPALTLKAKLAMLENRHGEAREALERALVVEPSSWYAQFLYGMQYYLGNEMQLALKPLERARQLNPRDPRSAVYLGLTYESVGRTTDAIALYSEARRLEEAAGESHADTLLIGARLLLLMDRIEESRNWVQTAVKLQPESRDVHFEMARILLKAGDARGAIAAGENALRFSGMEASTAQVHYLLIRACRAAGDEERAAKHAEALASIESQNAK